jgi:hypothetical protein
MSENDQDNISNDVTAHNNEHDEMEEAIVHEGDTDDERITIDDINIVSQMNSSQMAIDEEEQEQEWQPTHNYNLRERPTRRKQQVSLAIAQDNKVTGVINDKTTGVMNEGEYITTYPKTHAHVILTQMNVKEGLLAFGEKGNEAILKELRQLHEKRHYCPSWKKTCHMKSEGKHFDILCFWKKSVTGRLRHGDVPMEGHNDNTHQKLK